MGADDGIARPSSTVAKALISARVTGSPASIRPLTICAVIALDTLVPFIGNVLSLKNPLAKTPLWIRLSSQIAAAVGENAMG